jgi:lipoprotein-releasing system permease protein
VTAIIAVLAIGVGVASLVVALALANGFRDEMRDKILRGTAHLTVMRSDGQAMQNYREVARRASEAQGVVGASGTTYDGAVLIGPKASAYAVVRGLDSTSTQVKNDVTRTLVAGSAEPLFSNNNDQQVPQVIVGSELSARTGLQVGDSADLVSAGLASESNGVNRHRIRVAGIFRSGLFEYDSTWIYMPLNVAASVAGNHHAASVISIQVNDIYDVKRVGARVRETLGPEYTTVDWQEANRPLFTALAVERRIGVVIIALIILIGALNITTTLVLVVMERRRDIAILNAMGATGGSIMGIFIIEGAIVGLIGAVFGVALGGLATALANHFNLVSLPADVYSISRVPLHSNTKEMAIAALVAIVLSIVATLYPARAAANIRPAEMLRDA